MNKLLIMLFSLLTVVMLSSCDEVKDSPLLFKATSNTNPEYISVSYYPEEIGITFYPKVSKYFIYSYTYIDGDLELTCTNCDNINYSLDCSFGIVKNNVGKDISATEEEVGVSVKNTDNKTLRIHFAKLKDEDFAVGLLSRTSHYKSIWSSRRKRCNHKYFGLSLKTSFCNMMILVKSKDIKDYETSMK